MSGNADIASIELEERSPPREQIFDPDSLNAFTPPDYAKDPPKYQDINFGGPSAGSENFAFDDSEGINPSAAESLPPPPDEADPLGLDGGRQVTPPPPYTLYDAAHSEAQGSRNTSNEDDSEIDLAFSASAADSQQSSPRVIRVSSSPTIVDNRVVTLDRSPSAV